MKAGLFFFIAVFAFTIPCWLHADVADPIEIDIQGQPTLGYPKATVQVVAFLEPKCPDSKRYNNDVFPIFQKEYIFTNKVRYTVIPVSFLNRSMPAAIALLCVYHEDPDYPNSDLFFDYLNYIYLNQPPEKENWATTHKLLEFAAAASPAIQQDLLKKCIEKQHYRTQIAKNTALGIKIMGQISTPTIYVNGVRIENKYDTIDYDNLKAAIDEAFKSKVSQ